jgi:hypothetical protein
MLKNLLLVLLGLVLGLLTVEAGLRLLDSQLPDSLRYRAGLAQFLANTDGVYLPDPNLWHKGAPDIDRVISGHPDYTYHLQTNSLGYQGIGFRDDGFTSQPFAIAIGDSYTWGDGVDNNSSWVEKLETSTNLDIVNLGVSGYGSVQRLRVFQEYGLPLKPKLVLWSFFPNDFYDDGHFIWREETGRLAKRGQPQSEPDWPEKLDKSLRRSSLTYDWLKIPFTEPEDEEEWERLVYTDSTLDLTFVLRPYWEKRLDLSTEYVIRGQELTEQALSQVQASVDQTGAVLVVIYFPFKEQTYWPLVSTLVDNPEAYDLNWPENWLKAWCEAHEIAYLDLSPSFKERASQGEQLFFRYDAHWNEAGHTLAAQTIQQYLQDADLIPAPVASEKAN